MTELDFLPEWYQVRLEKRRSYFSFVWLGLCLVGVMGLWFYLANSQIRTCRAELASIKHEQGKVNEQLTAAEKLKAQRDEKIRRAEMVGRLVYVPDAIHVLRKLVDVVPEEITLLDVEISTEVIKETVAADKVKKHAAPSPNSPAAPKKPDRYRYVVRVVGAAPFDELIGNFVTRLSRCDAFTNVQIGYTKDIKRLARLMRQFELTAQVTEAYEATDDGVSHVVEPAAEAAPQAKPAADGTAPGEAMPVGEEMQTAK